MSCLCGCVYISPNTMSLGLFDGALVAELIWRTLSWVCFFSAIMSQVMVLPTYPWGDSSATPYVPGSQELHRQQWAFVFSLIWHFLLLYTMLQPSDFFLSQASIIFPVDNMNSTDHRGGGICRKSLLAAELVENKPATHNGRWTTNVSFLCRFRTVLHRLRKHLV